MRRRMIEVTHADPNTPSTAAASMAEINHTRLDENSSLSSDSRMPTDAVPITSPSSSRMGTLTRQEVPSVPVCVPT